MTSSASEANPITDETREKMLGEEVALRVRQGRRIESLQPLQAILVRGRPVSHLFHLVASVLTMGLWLPIWGLVAISGGERREMVTVDRFGNVVVEQL